MKIVLQKFLNSNLDGQMNVNDLLNKLESEYESQVCIYYLYFSPISQQSKLREMEEFKLNVIRQLESKGTLVYY